MNNNLTIQRSDPKGKAIASLILGIISAISPVTFILIVYFDKGYPNVPDFIIGAVVVAMVVLSPISGLIGLILGIMGLKSIKKIAAIIGIVLCMLGLLASILYIWLSLYTGA